MRIARVRRRGAETYGIVSDGRIATREEIRESTGVPVPPGIAEFAFGGWLDEVRGHAGSLEYSARMSEFEALAPLPRPPKIICVAFNYPGHASRYAGARGDGAPVIVIKPSTALCGASADIACPAFVRELDYETELAAVVGRTVRRESASEAAGAVFGYMVLDDVTARDVQFGDGQFTRAKSFDTFAPCGPWITTRDEAGDAARMRIRTRVNGELRQDAEAGQMRLGVADVMARLSESMTLEAGDIIAMGTPAGTALDTDGAGYLGDGDLVESEIGGLGSLHNRVRIVR